MSNEVSMPIKQKYRTAHGVIKNGAYRPRTGNSHPPKSGPKRVPKPPRGN